MRSGPRGAIILLLMRAADGTVYDVLVEVGGEMTRKITLEDFRRGYERQQPGAG